MERGQDVVELVVSNPNLQGTALRDLRLPGDTLVLSVFRNRASLICHGYTRLQVGDHITIVGSESSLEEIQLRFSDYVVLEPEQKIKRVSRDSSPSKAPKYSLS